MKKLYFFKLFYHRQIIQKRVSVEALDDTHAVQLIAKYVKKKYPKAKGHKVVL